MWKLVIEDDEGKRTIVPLTRDDYSVGRKEGNTIRLTERNVSRDHAKLSRRTNGAAATATTNGAAAHDGAIYALEDLTSYNGVYVNGLRVAHSQELQHGDLIQIGDYRIVLQDDAVAEAAPSTVPVTDPKSTMPTGATARAAALMERPNRLVMLAGPTPGAEYTLDHERLTVGRAEDATISINHNSVSRLHCEIHALGDGRFEIVDKGSSNGVRVNASELRRGIVEAGDVIELGDVKFKFIGAGQIFRPGATDSQQLAAIGERAAAQIVGKKKSSVAMPVMLFAVVVACGVAAAWYFTRPPPAAQDKPTPTTSVTSDYVDPEVQIIAEAKQLADKGAFEAAHATLKNQIPSTSKHRADADFRDIEDKWATDAIGRAKSMDDADKRHLLLVEVSQTKEVGDALRKQAADLLEDKGTSVSQLASVDGGPTTVDAGAKHRWDAGAHPVWDAGMALVPSATVTAPATTSKTADPLAVADPQAAMKARVFGSKSPDPNDVMLLRSLCRGKDQACVNQCNTILSQSAPKPSGTVAPGPTH